MTETRGITFRRLREMCQKRAYFYRTTESTKPIYYCISILYKYNGEKDIGCIAANCPIWKGLKVIERQ